MSTLTTEERSDLLRLMGQVMAVLDPSRAALQGKRLVFEMPASTMERLQEIAALAEQNDCLLLLSHVSLQLVPNTRPVRHVSEEP